MHWWVARMFTEPKSVDPPDNFFFVTAHLSSSATKCHKCKVPHCTFHASILCHSEICVGLHQFWAANLAATVVAFAAIVAAHAVMVPLITPVPVC